MEIITGVVKLNKSGVDSVENIADDKRFNYFIYTSGDGSIVNEKSHKLYFFDFLKKKEIINNSKLIIYRKNPRAWDYIKLKLKQENIPFGEKNNLSSSLEFVKKDIKKNNRIHKKNRVFILCDSMNYFDGNIVFLNA